MFANLTRVTTAGLFVFVMALFLFPWVSTDRQPTYSLSGIDLAIGRYVTDSRTGSQELAPRPFAIGVLALATGGLASTVLKGRSRMGVSGLIGGLGVLLLVWAWGDLHYYTPDFEPAFWLITLVFAAAAVMNSVAFGRGTLKKCVNSQAVYPLSEQDGLEAQERRYTAHEEGKH